MVTSSRRPTSTRRATRRSHAAFTSSTARFRWVFNAGKTSTSNAACSSSTCCNCRSRRVQGSGFRVQRRGEKGETEGRRGGGTERRREGGRTVGVTLRRDGSGL